MSVPMKPPGAVMWMLLVFCCASVPAVAKGGGEYGGGGSVERAASGGAGAGTASAVDPAAAGGTGPGGANAGAAAAKDPEGYRGELSVEEAVKAALANSVEIDLEKLNLRRSAAAVGEAQAAARPSVILQTSGSAMSNPQEGVMIRKGAFGYSPTVQSAAPVALPDRDYVLVEDAEPTYFKVTATLTQPLFTWGKLTEALRAAELDLDIAGEEYQQKEKLVDRQTCLAYFGVLVAETTAALLAQAASVAGEIMSDRENAFEEGVVTRQAVLEAAVTKASLTAELARAREAGATARLTLGRLTGTSPGDAVLTSVYRDMPMSAAEPDLLTAALMSSSERAVLLHRINQARALLDIEKASRPFLPDLSLHLSVDLTGQKVPFVSANWTDSWDTNVILTLGTQTTLFDSGASKSRIAQAQASLETAVQALKGLELTIEIRVRTLIEAVRNAWADLARVAAALESVEELKRNAAVSFENELITRAELEGSELALLAAQVEHEFALFGYESSLIELETFIGKTVVTRG